MQCQHFLDCINEGKRPRTDGLNGLRVVQVVEAAQQSLHLGGQAIAVSTNGHPQSQPEAEKELVHA